MKTFKLFFLVIFTLNTSLVLSQNIKSYQWKNRVLLVLTEDSNNEIFQNQIQELQVKKDGLTDRKLIVFQIKKDSFKIGLKDNTWQNSSEFYKKYKKNNKSFEIILIGLDGGIKLKQGDLITCEKLFSIIDVMPMRKQEMRNKKED